MQQYTSDSLIVHPEKTADAGCIVDVTQKRAGWNTIHFQARHLSADQTWSGITNHCEFALIVLSGTLDIHSTRGNWEEVGQRSNVFAGLPEALYLPCNTQFDVKAKIDGEFALAWAPASVDHEPCLIRSDSIKTELRGGGQTSRQINSILPPGFPCERLVVVEVYTPGGNWSSYPPHKHDVHKHGTDGQLMEADLDEIYFYQFDRPEGYALQRIYSGVTSPLTKAGNPIDVVLTAHHNDVVLVPEGYHPVSCPPGYTTYYLNLLAGSAQSLAASDDPDYAWVKTTFKQKDPRVPLYPINPL